MSATAQQQAQKIALAAADLLEAGNEDQAKIELKRALGIDPNSKLANNLTRQMSVDPVATLGRDSFAYTVKPSDSLSKIAQRFMGDLYAFYLLARYNDIKVPKNLAAGQVIRVPGKAPAPGAMPPDSGKLSTTPPPQTRTTAAGPAAPAAITPPPAPPPPPPPPELTPGERAMRNGAAAERAGDLPRALAEYRSAAAAGQTDAAARAEQVRKLLVTRNSANARSALARQDLDASIGQWEKVLELDPGQPTATLELQRVRGLKEKLKSVK